MKTRHLICCCLALLLPATLNAQWQTSGSNIYYNNGNVGIGTNSPNYILHSIANGNVSTTSAFLWGELYGAAIGVQSTNPNYYAFAVFNNISKNGNGGNQLFTVRSDGNVGIGTTNPTSKLTVAGDIRAREVKVEANAGADFVFAPDYRLRPLTEVEQFITANKHLPDIAPADSMVQNGVNVSEMQIRLLQKVEELTLYTIEQQRQIDALKEEVRELRVKN